VTFHHENSILKLTITTPRDANVMNSEVNTLTNKLERSFSNFSENNAIYVSGQHYTYSELKETASMIANAIYRLADGDNRESVAIFGYRSFHTYAAITGVVMAGATYLPLNPEFPISRLKTMVISSACKTLILCSECVEAFKELAETIPQMNVICTNVDEKLSAQVRSTTNHNFNFLMPSDLGCFTFPDARVKTDDSAYLLFTSGSTGQPKGVLVSHGNVVSYLNYTLNRYKVNKTDRVSQMFDITFDLSVHDIFITFLSGACLYVVPKTAIMAPTKFIREHALTIWFSVPSVVMFMERMRMLKPNSFPSLRLSLFCGEALPKRSAESWLSASPHSLLENLYGPTEATIAITNYRWTEESADSCINGLVPIGQPFEGHRIEIRKLDERTATEDKTGELCLSGPQVTRGYLDSLRNGGRFYEHQNERWYSTGDLVCMDSSGCLYYLGRIDEQIQIRGYRAELQEIDKVLRDATGTDMAVCVPKLLAPGQAECVVAFIEGHEGDYSEHDVIDLCRSSLPDYMVPTQIQYIATLPTNSNGKINRTALIEKIS